MRSLFAILALVLSTQALASNMLWMHESPARYFTESDWALLDQTLQQTLKTPEDGVTATWKNPETGHHGTITPLEAVTVDGQACHRTRFTNETPKASGRLDVTLCPAEKGGWVIRAK